MDKPPDEIHNVSMGYFSVARHYGGCTFMGHHYTYDPTKDILVRDDILKAKAKRQKKPKKKKV